jgi:hypothetical protein
MGKKGDWKGNIKDFFFNDRNLKRKVSGCNGKLEVSAVGFLEWEEPGSRLTKERLYSKERKRFRTWGIKKRG